MGKEEGRDPDTCTAFANDMIVATGRLSEVARRVKSVVAGDAWSRILIFDDRTCQPVELDLRGSTEEVLARLNKGRLAEGAWPASEPPVRGPGRPKLGVVAREVTLLPRHWEWLAAQPGGSSVALRKLVEEARRANPARNQTRLAREAAYRFMSAMAGNLPGFEEATRALFANQQPRFIELTEVWPPDIRDHARKIAAPSFEA